MASILQGTTPSLEITIKPEDFAVSDVTALELALSNASTLVVKGLSDVTVDTEKNSFVYMFTQDETLALSASNRLYHQWRFKFADGNIAGTRKASIDIEDLMSEETL